MAGRKARVEIFQGRRGQWYFRRVAGNGEITASSEGYTRKADAVRGARRQFPRAALVER